MDFNDTAEERAWRDEVMAWLEAMAPPHVLAPGSAAKSAETTSGETSGGTSLIERAKRWQATKFDAGLAKLTWDPALGGRNATQMQSIIFSQEEGKYRLPNAPFTVGLGMIAPTIKSVGTDAQKDRHLLKIVRGEEIWCQLFSEPGAGSDVAALSSTAVRDGDEWVINGQKVWTTGAHYSDFGEMICRTDPDAPKHRGITAFIVDMRSPGVKVQPLRQMNGAASFNEVFFDEVRVPADAVIGEVNQGWSVAITTLMNERVAIGASGAGESFNLARLIELVEERGLGDEPLLRQRIADLHIRSRVQKFIGWRTLTAISKGATPGPEGTITKLFASAYATDLGAVTTDVLGAYAVAEADGDFRYNNGLLTAPAYHLGGGTDEVLKNVIGERVLGLPPEPRVDKGVPWRDVPRSA